MLRKTENDNCNGNRHYTDLNGEKRITRILRVFAGRSALVQFGYHFFGQLTSRQESIRGHELRNRSQSRVQLQKQNAQVVDGTNSFTRVMRSIRLIRSLRLNPFESV